MKRAKLSGSAFRKKKAEREKTALLSKDSLLRFINQEKSSPEHPSVPDNQNLFSEEKMAVDEQNESENATEDLDVPLDTVANEHQTEKPEQNECFGNGNALTDIGAWPEAISMEFRDLMISKGTEQLQRKDYDFPKDDNGRSLTRVWFEKTLKNGQKISRTWLCFSPVKNSVFCFCCSLFPEKSCRNSFCNNIGFSTWQKLNPRIQDHKNSPDHRKAFLKWKELERSLVKGGLIDDQLQQQVVNEAKKWRDILERIIATIQTLAQQNLPLRGHRESVTGNSNPGNFLALLKYLAKFDPVMKTHLASTSDDSRNVKYLSPDIQNEIIFLLGNTVRKSIITECQRAKYYSIMFDTTPDVAHVEQMSQILRYVVVERSAVTVKEAFIDFIPIDVKTAEGITDVITNKLETDGLDLNNCRGQCYDNQSTMAGKISGVQRRILDLNPSAIFVNCDNHSLNLVGVHAASVNPPAVTFFGTIERIYVFFSSSTHRWTILKDHVNITMKGHSDTRWSSKAAAVSAISSQLEDVMKVLEKLTAATETIDTRQDATLIINMIENFSFLTMLFFWAEILSAVDKVQKLMQTEGQGFDEVLNLLDLLVEKLKDWRNDLPDQVIAKAEELCRQWDVSIISRTRRKKKMPGENADDAALSSRQELRRCLIEILDKLQVEISNRFTNMKLLKERFGFLCEFGMYVNNEKGWYKEQLPQLELKCQKLEELYPDDLTSGELFSDVKDVVILLERAKQNGEKLDLTPKGVLVYISSMGLEAYSALATVLRILLTLPMSVASCERSFSKLKLIKTYLRSTMSQDRLTNLAMLSIESTMACKIDYGDVIKDFANLKARKVQF